MKPRYFLGEKLLTDWLRWREERRRRSVISEKQRAYKDAGWVPLYGYKGKK